MSNAIHSTRCDALTRSLRATIRPSSFAGRDIFEVAPQAIVGAYRVTGVVLFRGFDVDRETFEALADRFTRTRDSDSFDSQKPLASSDDDDPWAEVDACAPSRPSLVWFYCESRGLPELDSPRLTLFEITSFASYVHVWEQGDILMLDNRRMMHGRTRLENPAAGRILTRTGHERFA